MSHCWHGDSGTDGREGSIWGGVLVQSEFPAFVYSHGGAFLPRARVRICAICPAALENGEWMKLKWLFDDCEGPEGTAAGAALSARGWPSPPNR